MPSTSWTILSSGASRIVTLQRQPRLRRVRRRALAPGPHRDDGEDGREEDEREDGPDEERAARKPTAQDLSHLVPSSFEMGPFPSGSVSFGGGTSLPSDCR